jgi:NAD(P)-dependent dehydrogenase (short-subunit alcohol dehydrogenase family)
MTTTPGQPWTVAEKLCLVTGATSGIGHAIATELACRGGRVLAVARNASRGEDAVDRIRRGAPGAKVEALVCDLSRMAAVRDLAAAVSGSYGRLDVLVNNAAVSMFTREVTEDGLETNFAVNHLAPFLLTNSLLPALGVPAESRVITVTSDNHKLVKAVPWDDLQGERSFRPMQAYSRTKLLNVWFTQVLAEKVAGTGITANCLSPGFVRTDLGRHARGPFGLFLRLAAPFQRSPRKGAETAVYLATSPEVSGVTGGYFAKSRPGKPGGLALADEQAHRLWALSAKLCGLPATP